MTETRIIVGSDGQDGKILLEKLKNYNGKIICLSKKNFNICKAEIC